MGAAPPPADAPSLDGRAQVLLLVWPAGVFVAAMALAFQILPPLEPDAGAGPGVEISEWILVALAPAGAAVCWWALRGGGGPPPTRFAPQTVAAAGVAGMVLAIVGQGAGVSVYRALFGDVGAVGGFVAYAFGWGLAAVPACFVLGAPRPHARVRGLGLGVLCWIGVLPLATALALLNGWLVTLAGRGAPLQPVMQEFIEAPAWERWVTAIPVVLLAPLFEELVFRGAIYRGLRQMAGVWPAAIASGLLFSAIHLAAPQALPIFVLGVLLALVYERSGTLVAPIAVHVSHNGLSLLLTAWA